MIICITVENGLVCGHFGHAEELMVYEIKKGSIVNKSTFKVTGAGHSNMVNTLKSLNCDCVITTNLGEHAVEALNEAEILLCKGVTGNPDDAIEKFLNGELNVENSIGEENFEEHHECNGHCGGCSGCC